MHHILLSPTEFNLVVERLRDAGILRHLFFQKPFVTFIKIIYLIHKWEINRKLIFQKAKYLVQKEEKENNASVFYLEHTFGAWIVLAIGLVLATLTFIYEYSSGKNVHERRTTVVQQLGQEIE